MSAVLDTTSTVSWDVTHTASRYSTIVVVPTLTVVANPPLTPRPTPGERSQVAQQWNQLRREIVTTALTQQLLPAVTQHYRAKLLAEARDAAVRQ